MSRFAARVCPSRESAGLPRRQRGVVLVFTLVFALLLLLPAMAAMKTGMMSERKSGDLRLQSLSMQAAEAAMAVAAAHLEVTVTLVNGTTGNGDYGLDESPFPDGSDGGALSAWAGFNWEGSPTRVTKVPVEVDGATRDAYYVIETLRLPPGYAAATGAFRVTAFARGISDEAATLLQATYVR